MLIPLFVSANLLPVEPTFRDATAEFALSIAGDGACWVDFNQDGFPDLCAGGGAWKNEAGRGFTKIADIGAVVAADFDNDGFPDLYSWNQRKLWKNVGGKSFEPFPLPEMPESVSRGACWGDFDNDGFVDLYIGGYEKRDETCPSFILRNKGGKSFEVHSTRDKFRTRGVTACDFDRDSDLDVYASNYRLQANNLYVNQGGEFKDMAAEFGVVATSEGFGGGHSIGAAWGDFDNDGNIDLFAGNFAHVDSRGDQPKSRFLRNRGSGGSYHFEDKGTCGVFYQESYASPAAGDFDNDGDLDLFFTTVYADASFGKKNYPVLYRNDREFKFVDSTLGAGLEKLGPTYQAAWADFDRDGDLDLVSAGRLFVNQTASRHWVTVRLRGDGKVVNRSAIGAQIRIRSGANILTRQVEAGTGEGNQNDLTIHIGLGLHPAPVDIVVSWPGGKTQTVKAVKVNQLVEVVFKP